MSEDYVNARECPYCHADMDDKILKDAWYDVYVSFNYKLDIPMHHVKCWKCHSMGPGCWNADQTEGRKAALHAWNTR